MGCVTPQAAGLRAFHWSIELPVPRGKTLDPASMTASELMFFYGAPLAHIVAYEEHLRRSRALKSLRGATRCLRPPRSLDALTSSACRVA